MTRLLKFAPAIILSAYVTAGNVWGFRPALMQPLSLAAVALMGAVLWAKRRREGLSAIDRGFFVYMACGPLIFWVMPDPWSHSITRFSAGLLYGILFVAVAFPAAARGAYFTEYFARKRTPKAFWETDLFKAVNRHMTWAWAAIFGVSTVLTLVPGLFFREGDHTMNVLFQVLIPIALVAGVGAPFNKLYPEYYKHRVGAGPSKSGAAAGSGIPDTVVPAIKMRFEEEKMESTLKVVAVNGSPHGTIGNASRMVGMIAGALAEEGIALEEVFLSGKTIAYCVGCAQCLEGTRCWQRDDYDIVMEKLVAADGIILASPVYFRHVTAQMKTFIDRSLSLGHKPRGTWKPGLAVAVSAGLAGNDTARYLEQTLRVYGAYSVGALSAVAVNPGEFLGIDSVRGRAQDLARDLARAMREKRRYPPSDEDLGFYLFMRDLVTRNKDFMRGDYRHWQEKGLLEGFEAYTGETFSQAPFDPAVRAAWIKEMVARAGSGRSERGQEKDPAGDAASAAGLLSARTCRELLKMMPLGFKGDAAQGLTAVFQFEMSGSEAFTTHLSIADGRCVFHDGPHDRPDVVIRSPADVWLAISKGELDGQAAFLSGKYTVEGDLALLLKLKDLFGR